MFPFYLGSGGSKIFHNENIKIIAKIHATQGFQVWMANKE